MLTGIKGDSQCKRVDALSQSKILELELAYLRIVAGRAEFTPISQAILYLLFPRLMLSVFLNLNVFNRNVIIIYQVYAVLYWKIKSLRCGSASLEGQPKLGLVTGEFGGNAHRDKR